MSENGTTVLKEQVSIWHDVLETCTTISHVFLIGFTALIIYLFAAYPITLFTWHPFLMTIGYVLITSEGILMMRTDNVLAKRLSFRTRARIHWIIQILAVLVPVTGFSIVSIYKNKEGMVHMKSWHALIGLNGVITSIVCSTGGISALYNLGLTKWIKPNVTKFVHAGGGLIAYGSAGIAILLALGSADFFTEKLNEDSRICLGVLVFVAFIWVVLRPLWTVLLRIRIFILDIIFMCKKKDRE